MTRVLPFFALAACIGEPIVGALPPPEDHGCEPAPLCDALEEPHLFGELSEHTFSPVDVGACLPGSEIVPEYCDGIRPSVWCSMQAQGCARLASSSALDEASAVGCRTDAPIAVSGTLDLTNVDLACSDLAFALEEGASVVIRDARLTGARLRIVGGPRSTVRIVESHGDHVFVALGGHAWLEVDDSTGIEDLRVDVEPAMEGRVVSLARSQAASLAVRAGPRAELYVERTQLSGATVVAGALVFARGAIMSSRIRADRALFGGGRLEGTKLELGAGVLSSMTATNIEVIECGSLYSEGTQITGSYLTACDDGFEMRGQSALTLSVVRGATLIADGLVENTVLAPGPDRLNRFEDVSVVKSAFCDSPELESVGGTLRCVACDPDIPAITLEGTSVLAPDCPSLEAAAMPAPTM
jgi:hypothetical protein